MNIQNIMLLLVVCLKCSTKVFSKTLKLFCPILWLVLLSNLVFAVEMPSKLKQDVKVTQGVLASKDTSGNLLGIYSPRHTEVKAEISGFIAHVKVTQTFQNFFNDPIEATYMFPLPQDAAVDSMAMEVGSRIIHAAIKRREEAQALYQAAKSSGRLASLLDQERPNIFTQSVVNILPGQEIKVIITYVDMLKYEDGNYEFTFPMVVGERYIPTPEVTRKNGKNEVTGYVPDAAKIASLETSEMLRSGHDISITVEIDGGMAIDEVKSTLHEIELQQTAVHQAIIRLKDRETIPNKDFILKYKVAGDEIKDAILASNTKQGGFFTFILQPPKRIAVEQVTPKELIFVVDTSGSMSGAPMEKAKEVINFALAELYPKDTFNLITFSGDTSILFPQPVFATSENIKIAKDFLLSRSGSGGTEMMKAIRAALDPSDKQDHLRIVCFLTDGDVGNDMEIISEVKKHTKARVFSMGLSDSPNRFLLDSMARYGRGEVDYVTNKDSGVVAAKRFYEKVRNPLLTDISINWNNLAVLDVYPQNIPDLFANKPLILSGRYEEGSSGIITLKGKLSGQEFVRQIPVSLPTNEPKHSVLATLWARRKIDSLMGLDYEGLQQNNISQTLRDEITELGLKFHLITQFTSFVAYETTLTTKEDKVYVPAQELAQNFGSQTSAYNYGGSQTEDFCMWGMIQKMSFTNRLVNIVLTIMAICVIVYSIERFFTLRKIRKLIFRKK